MAKDYIDVYRSLLAVLAIRRCAGRRYSGSPTAGGAHQRQWTSALLKQNSTATPVEEVPGNSLLHSGDRILHPAPPHAQAGDCFAVLDSYADIGASPGGPDGIFFCDTRHLSHLEMLLNGRQPLLLGSNVRDDNSILTVDLTNPDIYLDQQAGAAEGRAAHRAHAFSLARHRLPAPAHARTTATVPFDVQLVARLCQRLCRSVRSARHAPRAARQHATWRSAPARSPGLPGPRRHRRRTDDLRSSRRRNSCRAAPPPMRLSLQPHAVPLDLCDGEMRTRRRRRTPPLPFRKGLRAAFQRAPDRQPRHGHHHQLECDLQRGACAARWPTSRC